MREISKSVIKFIFGLVIVFIVSAFLAPWLFTFLPFKFERILRRLIMIGALGLVFWLMRVQGLKWSRMGLRWQKESLLILVKGLLTGIFIVISMTVFQWALGARFWQPSEMTPIGWVGLVSNALGAGLLIGLIEEFFFRGFAYFTFKDLWNGKISLIVTNLIYAMVHFFPKSKPFVGPEPTVWDSFRIYGSMTPSIFAKPDALVQLLGLFLFGLLLSFAFLKKGSLYLSIGIHAGCVFAVKMAPRLLPEISHKMSLLSGTGKLYDGIAGLTILAAFALFLGISLINSRSSSRKGLALGLVLLLFFPALPVLAQRPVPLPKEIAYSFLLNLSQARAIRASEGQAFEGRWSGNRFSFEGLPQDADISVNESVLVEGKMRRVIWFPGLPRYESSLVFSKVPARKRLRVFYALSDASFQKGGELIPVQFEVWIGRKKLFETRVSSPGWQEKSLDLTFPFMLHRSFRFSFKVQNAGRQTASFVFYAYIE